VPPGIVIPAFARARDETTTTTLAYHGQMHRAILFSLTCLLLAPLVPADEVSGKVFHFDPKARSFELLKETGYDPKTDMGNSRLTVVWSEQTPMIRVEPKSSFAGVKGPILGKAVAATARAALEKPEKILPLPGETFLVDDHVAFVILPGNRDATKPTPWVWYAPTLPKLPGPEEKWIFEALLAKGVAIGGIDVGESMGNPEGRRLFTAFHREMTGKRGMAAKPCLLARSRGGLMHYNWAAENPDSLAAIAGIYPVGNLASWPGLARAKDAYGMDEAGLAAALPSHNPIDRLEPLAKAGVPLFHIHGDNDTVVPLDKNSGLLKERYDKLGGKMILDIVPGGGHDMKPEWFRNQKLVDFPVEHAKPRPE
jgi:pimeloyl-ACP methyl ester carboxylesterase